MHMISYNIPKMDQVAERLCLGVDLHHLGSIYLQTACIVCAVYTVCYLRTGR